MFSKSTIFTALLVFLGFALSFADAQAPPACVISCVNEFEKVADLKTICKDGAGMSECLGRECDSSALQKTALQHYKDTCKDAGIVVVIPTSTSSTTTATATSNSTVTGTANHTTTATTSKFPNATGGTTTDNANASSKVYINTMLALAAIFAAALTL